MKMLPLLRKILCVGTIALLASCAQVSKLQYTDHPLAGKVWDALAGRFVEPGEILERAVDARFVLLGETHDNTEHHRIQAQILDTLVERGRRPALVMEQFDIEQQAAINGIVQGSTSEADKLKALGALMRKGWEWPVYEPVVRIALAHKLPIIAANLSRDATRQIARQGFELLGAGEAERLALDAVWTPQRQQQLMQELEAGHCGKMPAHMGEAIAKSQRARDAVLADMLIKTAKNGAVAILGRGHARRDMAVPLYLAARASGAPVLSLGLVEVDAPVNPVAYAYGSLGPRHDYLWFTPRVRRHADPCDSMPAQPAKPAAQG
jgi:uncharacterized iron-regulated protein